MYKNFPNLKTPALLKFNHPTDFYTYQLSKSRDHYRSKTPLTSNDAHKT
jgi:hypothetical protein